MNLVRWTFAGRGKIRAYFDIFPASTVVLSKIKSYYFVQNVRWNESDPIVDREALVEMERIINREMETLDAYNERRNK
ncbi:hypothetical protein [Jeotgalibacillus campisalis]|uniref:Uncharacterized protein n=1 Tax=Jeotgalibacillus campisalis TaxID=220754 RepID=A0A0C2RC26_9BACL|nr:hypothetical protein [Jeotgalibacillus campisalis]KIL47855.1 hypothetical protein KR50_20220 [Jeotgalibacillus campisalis]